MILTQFDLALNRYEATLITLENTNRQLLPEVVLDVLIARDRVEKQLNQVRDIHSQKLLTLFQFDCRLKKQAKVITNIVNLNDLRKSFHPHPEAWWWFLEAPIHPFDYFDWLWNAGTLGSLIISFSLVVDISSRFISGGPGFLSSLAVASQLLLTLLTAGGVFTEAGHTRIEKILLRLKIKKYLWQEVKLGLSMLLLAILLVFRYSLPQVASYFTEKGVENYVNGQIKSAKSNLERAIALNPEDEEAHFNLGRLYEDLQELKQARTYYSIAVGGHLDVAYNALGRLYIQEGKYSQAASLLQQALFDLDSQNAQVRYALLKNLGWTRFKQKRYAEAQSNLEDAIALNEKGSAHCLLAQVLEIRESKGKALSEWEQCLRYANPRYPEDDDWINLARQRVDSQEN